MKSFAKRMSVSKKLVNYLINEFPIEVRRHAFVDSGKDYIRLTFNPPCYSLNNPDFIAFALARHIGFIRYRTTYDKAFGFVYYFSPVGARVRKPVAVVEANDGPLSRIDHLIESLPWTFYIRHLGGNKFAVYNIEAGAGNLLDYALEFINSCLGGEKGEV